MARAQLANERPREPMQTPKADLKPLPHPAGEVRDEALAARAQSGDAGAFDALVALFTDRVFGVAYRVRVDRAEAEDLA